MQVPAAARRCNCPACGQALTVTPDLEGLLVTCPHCAVDFRAPGRRRFRCPHCGSQEPPEHSRRIATRGWVIFALYLVFFFPLFWIGLLITEPETRCYDCRRRLN
jgi:hypothetical protein